MCMGSSPPRATITVPDYERFDRMADRQIGLMQSKMQGKTLMAQDALNQALAGRQAAQTQLLAAQEAAANATAADAQRMAALIGTPPPEPTAKAPVIGDSRQGMDPAEGKRSLRIDRKPRPRSSASAGLNIGGY